MKNSPAKKPNRILPPNKLAYTPAMNKVAVSALLFAVGFTARDAHAKAAYQPLDVMVANSDAIAIVQVDQVVATQIKGSHWSYGQKALARVQQTLKGQLPATPTLLGDENFECASCHFDEGRYLVFLKREKMGWAGVNWHLSARKTENGLITWRENEEVRANLNDRLTAIKAILRKQAIAPTFSLAASTQNKARIWNVSQAGKPQRQHTQAQLVDWLCTLTPGTKVSLCNSCRGGNATSEEVQTLRLYAHNSGLNFIIIPAG
ncbi:hypothetical protein EON83_19390 [bacterium]|nr:MAG: hypothetical protein EON83_19390 [bacterium]